MIRLWSRRKRQFVSGPIQGRMMFQIGLYWVLYHIVLFHAICLFHFVEQRMGTSPAPTPFSLGELYRYSLQDCYPIIICAVGILPVVIIDVMKLTHRIAGPLVRIESLLRDMADGKPVAPVQLRKGDLPIEFQLAFNRYLASLAQRRALTGTGTADEKQIAADVGELCRNVRATVAPASSADSRPTAEATPVPLG